MNSSTIHQVPIFILTGIFVVNFQKKLSTRTNVVSWKLLCLQIDDNNKHTNSCNCIVSEQAGVAQPQFNNFYAIMTKKTEQIRSDQIALKLFTKFGQGNFRGVAKHCFD